MPRARSMMSQEDLEKLVKCGAKKFVRYDEGAQLYSLGKNTFMDLAKDADAVYRIKNCVLVNTQKVDLFIEENLKDGPF